MFSERAVGHVEKRAEQERAIAPPVPNTVLPNIREFHLLVRSRIQPSGAIIVLPVFETTMAAELRYGTYRDAEILNGLRPCAG